MVDMDQSVSWVSFGRLSTSSHALCLYIRLRKLATKSPHLSVVRKKRLLGLPRSVHLDLNPRPSFNIIVAICIDGYSFPQKEVVWTDSDEILYDARNIMIQLLIGNIGASHVSTG